MVQNENLRTEDGTISNAAPDICFVYKLHMECGRLINLYHWQEVGFYKESNTCWYSLLNKSTLHIALSEFVCILQAYATVVSAAEGKDADCGLWQSG